MSAIELDVLPHQAEFMEANERYVALVGGFGCGKSFGVGLKLWNLARINAGFEGMLVSRSATQLRKLCGEVETVFNLLGTKFKKSGFDEYHLDFGTKNSTVIYLGTTENDAFKRWAGGNLAFCVIDEFDTMPKAEEVWKFANDRVRVKAPLLQTAVATTPEGFNATWKFWQDDVNKDPSLRSSRRLIKGCTFDNPYIDPEYVRSQIQTRDPRTLRSYVYGEFTNLEGAPVYYRYDTKKCATDLTLDDPRFASSIWHVSLDFNKNINAGNIAVVKDGIVFALDELYGATNIDMFIALLNKKLTKDRQFCIYPDASGFEGIAQLERAYGKERILYPRKNPPVESRVTSVNERLVSAAGTVRTYVNQEKCPHLHAGLFRQVRTKEGDPDKTSGLDHSTDGWGYFVWHHWPIQSGVLSQARLVG